jgi:hypothetical protein
VISREVKIEIIQARRREGAFNTASPQGSFPAGGTEETPRKLISVLFMCKENRIMGSGGIWYSRYRFNWCQCVA